MAFLNNVQFAPGSQNLGGIAFNSIKGCPWAWVDIENFPLPDDDGTITDDIPLLPGYNMIEIYATAETGEARWEAQGEKDGGSFKNSLGWNTPSNKQDNMKFARRSVNGPWLYVAMDSDGQNRLIGFVDFKNGNRIQYPVYRETIVGTTGKAGTDKRGIEYMFSGSSPVEPPLYMGSVGNLLLAVPIAIAPTSILATSAVANWNASDDATSYRLDVSVNEDFSSYVSGYNNRAVSGTTQSITGLTTGTTYYYRVRAVRGTAVVSGDSNVISFTTA